MQQTEALAHGLRVQLHHHPHLKQAAAWLRVSAGSHDVPSAWPGLAHFLEHLFFLGTERFNGDQALMPFVQRRGGQLNATTRERTTDFFFELPTPSFAGGLERLCEMLGQPRLGAAEQRREREVIHAEFIAWSRDPQARHEQWLTAPLNPAHPLRAFHAGNRYSLPVPRRAFQQALLDFYQHHYQTAQMTLCLVGPQPLSELRALAQQASGLLRPGLGCAQSAPPPLLTAPAPGDPPPDESRLNLVFACEQLPDGDLPATHFLATWITSTHTGGLLSELRRLGWAQSLQLKALYRHAGQALVDLEVRLSDKGRSHRAAVAAYCLDWLESFQAHDDWEGLREEFKLLQERRLLVGSALELARHFIDPSAPADFTVALRALLGQMRREQLIHAGQAPDVVIAAPSWRLPLRNRFLRASRRPLHDIPDSPAITYEAGSTDSHPQAWVRLRWRVNARQHPQLWQTLEGALQKIVSEAEQAGVKLVFSRLGADWFLNCVGVATAIAPVLGQALATLRQPDSACWSHSPPAAAAQIPIRELLARLPEVTLGDAAVRVDEENVGPAALQQCWARARWDGLALGLQAAEREAFNEVLHSVPGTPVPHLSTPPARLSGWQWHSLATPSSEHAVLLFCPVVGTTLADEAAWRLLAQVAQAPFYQRLRVELQLGYAVFSDWRQFAGRGGLLFGVQSPATPVPALLAHMETFIRDLPALIAGLAAEDLRAQAEDLAARFTPQHLDPAKAGEWLWQARLAGHGSDYLLLLRQALVAVDQAALLAASRALGGVDTPRRLLANTREADHRWQVADAP
ncbi:pyrroloquinoline quinone biosynthesis protein PqqF [Pseudomonas sp. dw_358]|uniref:pyrroloquinoline quinone biosynthesis protein PqqF n=1 Tax=Pseudomonas sp. dw_358 TaxID=2720083 RepID=UPI001BD45179